MSVRLFVRNLSWKVTTVGLREFFEASGFAVKTTYLAVDGTTRRSHGFGFVDLFPDQDGARAIQSLNGQLLEGRRVAVSAAHPRSDRVHDIGCARCGSSECFRFAGILLCEGCLFLIIHEWSIKRTEFGELVSS
jgi:hypothetical protein